MVMLSLNKGAHQSACLAQPDWHCWNSLSRLADIASTRVVIYVYTASKVKHHLNIFLEKTVKLSKHEFILVIFLKRDKVVTIYNKF